MPSRALSRERILTVEVPAASVDMLNKLAQQVYDLTGVPLNPNTNFAKKLSTWQSEMSETVKHGLQEHHKTAYSWGRMRGREYTGTSYASINHTYGKSNEYWTGRVDHVGYIPTAAQIEEAPGRRGVLQYWGGYNRATGATHLGTLLGGRSAGTIKAPVTGISGAGVFGGAGWNRLMDWASRKDLTLFQPRSRLPRVIKVPRFGRPGRRVQAPLMHLVNRQLVWVLVRAMEKRGIGKDNVFETFASEKLVPILTEYEGKLTELWNKHAASMARASGTRYAE